MIKTFTYTDNTRLSRNFTAREFRCKCGVPHTFRIDSALVDKLQKAVDILGADKAIINSGFRCPTHDKRAGGNGSGMHTRGQAADVVFYKGGKPISTKRVAAVMQDLGFGGIANIDDTYTAIHGDTRSGKKWYGDEAVPGGTSGSVTDDFYEYYKLERTSLTSAVKALQTLLNNKGAALSVDGIAGTQTLTECKKYTIDIGDSGELTKWVQERLKSLGYDVGVIDGIAGNKTMKAINKWQSEHNLGAGYLGGIDWKELTSEG